MSTPVRSTTSSPTSTKKKSQFLWSLNLSNPIPYKFRARRLRSKLRARQSAASSISAIQTSFSPSITLRAIRHHRWTIYDVQYIGLFLLAIFVLCITPKPGPLAKTGVVGLLIAGLLMPVTSQFLFPALPILAWVSYFFSARFIPSDIRPGIWVRVLPALENIFYGANLSNILSAHQHVVLDVLAWLPYGLIHFAGPFICAIFMFGMAAPGTVPVFGRSFGYVNLIGVTIQLLFPCSPPWYENMYGLAPANYGMQGSPAGLARIDLLLGIDMYTTNFTSNSPLVFGAFPSLHAGNAVLCALFMSHCFPKLRPVFIGYTMWLWWATMYLSHHYAVDLVGGSFISAIVFYIAKTNWLPRRQADKTFRWDYDYVEIGDAPTGSSSGYEYGLTELHEFHNRISSDEWTMGSSSSVSSGSISPVDKESDRNSLWEGETLASQQSDSELSDVVVR